MAETSRQPKDHIDALRHIDALDGLRAAAILLVFLFHLTPGDDSNQGLRSLLSKVADIGWTGVDLFFVLSGFLITGKLLQARAEPHRFRDFYIRRSLRIFPLYYAALAFVLLVLPLVSRTPPSPALTAGSSASMSSSSSPAS